MRCAPAVGTSPLAAGAHLLDKTGHQQAGLDIREDAPLHAQNLYQRGQELQGLNHTGRVDHIVQGKSKRFHDRGQGLQGPNHAGRIRHRGPGKVEKLSLAGRKNEEGTWSIHFGVRFTTALNGMV